MPQNAIVQLRGDTAATWTSVNPILYEKELGLELDSNRLKMGDGVTAWNSLPYIDGGAFYRYALNGCDNILASEVLLNHVVIREHTLDADFTTSVLVEIEANPTADPWVASITVDNVEIGTISISAAGVITKTTTGGLAQVIPEGSRVKVVAPASADGTIAGFAVTFEGVI